MNRLKESFIKSKYPRFKEFAVSRHQPFGKTSDYITCIEKADYVKMSKLVKLVRMFFKQKFICFGELKLEQPSRREL